MLRPKFSNLSRGPGDTVAVGENPVGFETVLLRVSLTIFLSLGCDVLDISYDLHGI